MNPSSSHLQDVFPVEGIDLQVCPSQCLSSDWNNEVVHSRGCFSAGLLSPFGVWGEIWSKLCSHESCAILGGGWGQGGTLRLELGPWWSLTKGVRSSWQIRPVEVWKTQVECKATSPLTFVPCRTRANQSGFTFGCNFWCCSFGLVLAKGKMEQSFKPQVWAVEWSPGIPFTPKSAQQAAPQKLFPTATQTGLGGGVFSSSILQAQDYKQQVMGLRKLPNSAPGYFLSWKCSFCSAGSQWEGPSPTLWTSLVEGWIILGTTFPSLAVLGEKNEI